MRTILLVEDNPDDAMLTLRALRRQGIEADVVVARDGVEALEYLQRAVATSSRTSTALPAVILLDLKLPKIDGLELLRRLRREPGTRLIPVVVVSSSIEDSDLVQSYSLGANSYIRKTVDSTAFNEVVRQVGLYWVVLNLPAPRPSG